MVGSVSREDRTGPRVAVDGRHRPIRLSSQYFRQQPGKQFSLLYYAVRRLIGLVLSQFEDDGSDCKQVVILGGTGFKSRRLVETPLSSDGA